MTGTRPDEGEQQPEHHSAARAARRARQNGPRSVMYSNVHVVVSVVVIVIVRASRAATHASLIFACIASPILFDYSIVGSSLVGHSSYTMAYARNRTCK